MGSHFFRDKGIIKYNLLSLARYCSVSAFTFQILKMLWGASGSCQQQKVQKSRVGVDYRSDTSCPAHPATLSGYLYKPNWTKNIPATCLNAAGSLGAPTCPPQYRQQLTDHEPPSLGYTKKTGNNQLPKSKYTELLATIKELGKEIRLTYTENKSYDGETKMRHHAC